MSDFARFCPKCYAFFRDPDLYATHVATCGTAQKKDAETVKEPKKTAVKRNQEQGVRSQNRADKGEPSEAGSETSDSCLLSPDSSSTPSETLVPSVETEQPAKVKPPKFKT